MTDYEDPDAGREHWRTEPLKQGGHLKVWANRPDGKDQFDVFIVRYERVAGPHGPSLRCEHLTPNGWMTHSEDERISPAVSVAACQMIGGRDELLLRMQDLLGSALLKVRVDRVGDPA